MIHQHLRPRGRIIGISAVVGGVSGDASNKESNGFGSVFIRQASKPTANQSESYPLGYGIKSIYLPIKSGGIAAKLSGSGVVSSLVKGIGSIQATLAGTSVLAPHGNMGKQISATLSGDGTLTAALKGKGNLSSTILIGASPSTTEIADAIWSRSSIPFNEPNTMGKKLNDAGGASNPWEANIASNNTPGTFGWFIQKLLTVSKFLGLK